MRHKPGSIEALAEVIANASKGVKPIPPKLRVVEPRMIPTQFDTITRDACLRRIRFMSRAFGLDWLIEQATFNRVNLQSLDDSEVYALLLEMERARELADAGIPLEDGNFVRNISELLPPVL